MENQADKSQEATPFKLEEARKKGQVGRSQEFVSICCVSVMLACLVGLLPRLASDLVASLDVWLRQANYLARSDALLLMHVGTFLQSAGTAVLIILIAGAVTAILSNMLHAGPVFSLHPLKLDLTKLNPANGLKRIFSKKGLFEIVKVALKILFIGGVGVFLWGQIKGLVLYHNSLALTNIAVNWKKALTAVLVTFLGIFLVFALFDLWYSKKDFATKMRMSTRDLKDEYKKREGDPEIKQKRKRNMQQLLKTAMSMSSLKSADVIITNPTHYAVALQYRASSMPLPKVLTKGRGLAAKFIIGKARVLGIPIYRRPPLARAIFKDTSTGSYIAFDQQSAVADIYRELIKRPGSRILK